MKVADALKQHGLSIGPSSIQGWLDFQAPVRIAAGATLRHAAIGAYSYLEAGAQVINASLGRYCSVAEGARVGLSRHDPQAATTHAFPGVNLFKFHAPHHLPQPWFDPHLACVAVEDDVWIGANAIIVGHRMTRIGRGAIIAAGAVVTKDVPPYSIVAGNPARILRPRFAPEIANSLAATGWWEFDLPRYAGDFPADPPPMQRPEDFIGWWALGGEARVQTYRLPAGRTRLRREGEQWTVETLQDGASP
jgi:acetyltransferase-like isoleucine patch superfamily enzyme